MMDLKRNLVVLMGVTTVVVVISAMSLYKLSGLTPKHEVSDEVLVMVGKKVIAIAPSCRFLFLFD